MKRMLNYGDLVTVTIQAFKNTPPYTVKTPSGKPKLFKVVEEGKTLGIMYPGRDHDGNWHDAQFTPFDHFAWTVTFTRGSDGMQFHNDTMYNTLVEGKGSVWASAGEPSGISEKVSPDTALQN